MRPRSMSRPAILFPLFAELTVLNGIGPKLARLVSPLGKLLYVPVKIQHGKSRTGRVTIRYASLEELDGILEHIR